MVQHQV